MVRHADSITAHAQSTQQQQHHASASAKIKIKKNKAVPGQNKTFTKQQRKQNAHMDG